MSRLKSWRVLWFNTYPGTREELILVVEAPPTELRQPLRNGERRRAELADFLRKRRAAIAPEDVGLPGGGRRRTPGLRREEVALLAGVGTTWYTWLEQGRDVRASLDVLEAIATALHMTGAERAHLIELGRGTSHEPPFNPACAEQVSPMLRRLIENLDPNPAYLLGRRWDYLAWNGAACALLGDLGAIPDHLRNHIWQTFMDPSRRELFTDWDQSARLLVAKFRADSARHIDDPAWEELTQALRRASSDFCKMWRRHEVAVHGTARKILNPPVAGRLAFEHAVLNPQDSPDQRLILYTPLPNDGTAEKMAELLQALPA